MVVKPTPGADADVWGQVLNDALDALQAAVDARVEEAVLTAKGDLIVAAAAGVPNRLGVGAAGTYLAADATTATGLGWKTPPAPAAMAAGTATITFATASTSVGPIVVTLPAGRFSAAPAVTATQTSSTGTQRLFVKLTGVTATQASLWVFGETGVTVAAGTVVTVDWIAMAKG